jgi:hypothetical protein
MPLRPLIGGFRSSLTPWTRASKPKACSVLHNWALPTARMPRNTMANSLPRQGRARSSIFSVRGRFCLGKQMSAKLFFLPYSDGHRERHRPTRRTAVLLPDRHADKASDLHHQFARRAADEPGYGTGAGRFADIYLDDTQTYRLIVKDKSRGHARRHRPVYSGNGRGPCRRQRKRDRERPWRACGHDRRHGLSTQWRSSRSPDARGCSSGRSATSRHT